MSGQQDVRVLVGCSPDERGDDALALAALVVRTAKVPLTGVNVRPTGWPARGPGSVDAEWLAYLKERSEEALARAETRLSELGVPKRSMEFRAYAHRSSGRGLIEVAVDVGARLIVIGSAPRGRRGRVAIGSTADQLLHGSPVPVLLAPRGYAEEAPERFERLTVAYWRRRDVDGPLAAAARVAAALDLPMRLVTLVPRPPGLAARLRDADRLMARQVAQAEEDLDRAAASLDGGTRVATEVAVGSGITAALGTVDMLPGEVLACLSSHEGPLRKVFLGEGSGKIVRASPCPVVVLPRSVAEA
ncbi:universal stress protein [Actinomadura fibrosa]|uniref:Universal stress protein n=1 Tax=Actinomadura fibrosa TaxID=111802 RepID=A0ABW2XXF0_9ACTN|nr:universal stress protein [Actinomadura fibrosa]